MKTFIEVVGIAGGWLYLCALAVSMTKLAKAVRAEAIRAAQSPCQDPKACGDFCEGKCVK